MKFQTQQYAHISTAYLTESDLDLISRTDAPNHMAEHDTGRASFFFPPTLDRAVRQHFAEESRAFGLSKKFITIMLGLSRQEIQYVRFDADGESIEGLERCSEYGSEKYIPAT